MELVELNAMQPNSTEGKRTNQNTNQESYMKNLLDPEQDQDPDPDQDFEHSFKNELIEGEEDEGEGDENVYLNDSIEVPLEEIPPKFEQNNIPNILYYLEVS